MTKVDPNIDAKPPPHEFLSKKDKKNYEMCTPNQSIFSFQKPDLLSSDDPQVFMNAPVGLQLVGRTLEEEAVIAMTEIVDAALKGLNVPSKL